MNDERTRAGSICRAEVFDEPRSRYSAYASNYSSRDMPACLINSLSSFGPISFRLGSLSRWSPFCMKACLAPENGPLYPRARNF